MQAPATRKPGSCRSQSLLGQHSLVLTGPPRLCELVLLRRGTKASGICQTAAYVRQQHKSLQSTVQAYDVTRILASIQLCDVVNHDRCDSDSKRILHVKVCDQWVAAPFQQIPKRQAAVRSSFQRGNVFVKTGEAAGWYETSKKPCIIPECIV